MTHEEIMMDEIVGLRQGAAAAGDEKQVAICDRALAGDEEAIAICRDVIADAFEEAKFQEEKERRRELEGY